LAESPEVEEASERVPAWKDGPYACICGLLHVENPIDRRRKAHEHEIDTGEP
jgi:hypothetical protein